VRHEAFARVVVADREGLAPSVSSMPATILGVFDRVRERFAASAVAIDAGLTKKDFSTAARGARCEACEGVGRVRVSMDFLPDVWVPCAECGGLRYQARALACLVGGRSIADVLAMTVREAVPWFDGDRAVARALATLEELGLGYLRLGQGADTLSGGERQRLRLAAELMRDGQGPTLFLFDEPTTGLHFADVERLLQAFDQLAAAGHSLVVVEHNLALVAAADWVIDLGPEGGDRGGRVVATGTPSDIAKVAGSWTGRALRARESGAGTSVASQP
jgi:excinuclease ABC subunit A